MLNEKLVQNLTANIDASLAAALAIAKAQSLPEALKLHTEFFQKLAAQTPEQTKEFFDLSTRRVWVSLRRMLSTRTLRHHRHGRDRTLQRALDKLVADGQVDERRTP